MNRTQKFAVNSFSSILQQIIVMVIGIITPRIMLIYYGSEINGLITSLTQFFSYFSLVEAGLSSAAVYALYKPLAMKDEQGINGILSATNIFYKKSGLLFLMLTVLLAVGYPIFIKAESLNYFEIVFLIFALGFSGCLDFFTLSKYRAILTADQKLYIINIANIVHYIINMIIVIIMAQLQVNVVVLKTVALLSVVMRSIILICFCKCSYGYLDFSVVPNYQPLKKRWDALYLQILGVIHTGAPVLIITFVLRDLKLASVYAVYNLVIAGIGGIVGVFSSGLASSFGEIIAVGQRDTLKKAYREFECAYYIIITILYSVSFVMIDPFIKLYTADIHDANYNMPILGFLIVLNGLLYNLKTPQGMLVTSAGHFKETRLQTSIQGAIAVIGGVVFSMLFGIYGVVIGSILSNIYRDIDLLFYVPKKITNTSWKTTVCHVGSVVLIVLIVLSIANRLNIHIDNYLQWCYWALILAIGASIVAIGTMIIVDKKGIMGLVNRFAIFIKKDK